MTKMTSKAALIAIIPAVIIPVMVALERCHAPDFVVGGWVGSMIGLQILLLTVAVKKGRSC